MRFSKTVPLLFLPLFALLTISNLQADPAKAKRKGTPTPTPTPTGAAQPTAAAARVAAPPAAPTPSPAPAPAPAHPIAAVPPPGPAKADAEAGKALYAKLCQKCHGAQGEGVPRMYQLVGAKLVPLTSPQTQGKSDADIKKNMLEGTGKMEPIDDLTPQQADKILAFVRTLNEAKR